MEKIFAVVKTEDGVNEILYTNLDFVNIVRFFNDLFKSIKEKDESCVITNKITFTTETAKYYIKTIEREV